MNLTLYLQLRELRHSKVLQSVDDVSLVEVVDPAASSQLEVAHKLQNCRPLVGEVVSQPQTSEDGEEIVDLLNVLVRVEDEHLPGVTEELALRGVEGGEGAGGAAEGETAGLAPDYLCVEQGAAAGHTAHLRHLPGPPGHGSLLQHDVPHLHLTGGDQGPPPALSHLHTDPALPCTEHSPLQL